MVALRGISRRGESLILVTEYCPKGTLHLLLHGTAQSQLDAFKVAFSFPGGGGVGDMDACGGGRGGADACGGGSWGETRMPVGKGKRGG